MKKWIVMLLMLALIVSMAGCAMTGGPAEDTAENIGDSDELPDKKEEALEEETAEEPEAAIETEEVIEAVEELTELDLTAVAELLEAAGMPEMIELDEMLMLDYCGIAQEDVKQAVVAICSDSLRTDELWLVEAIDEEAAQRIMELAEFRLEMKGEESITYSPEQYEIVQQAQLLQDGSLIALLVSPEVETLAALYEQLIAG